MNDLILPDRRLETLELVYQGRKPIGNVVLDRAHPVVYGADDLLLCNDNSLKNLIDGQSWSADTTYDNVEYQCEPTNGNLALVRQDLDEAGICYKSNIESKVGVPSFFICIFTVLVAPTGTSKGVLCNGGSPHTGKPRWALNSGSTSILRLYVNGTFLFDSIPVIVGRSQMVVHRWDGNNTHDFYSSSKGGWENASGVDSNSKIGQRNYIGSGYIAELPCAFELFISGCNESIPRLSDLKEFVNDPYQFLIPS